jgi:hypothetical protein
MLASASVSMVSVSRLMISVTSKMRSRAVVAVTHQQHREETEETRVAVIRPGTEELVVMAVPEEI